MANFNINKVIIGGRLTADPELKTTPSGVAVVSFTMAVNRRYQAKDANETQADFITVTAWRQTAEFVTRFFRKASSICIVGSIQTRKWTDTQGATRYATEVVADGVHFVDSKTDAAASTSAPAVAPASQYVPEQYQTQPHFEKLGDNEELPF